MIFKPRKMEKNKFKTCAVSSCCSPNGIMYFCFPKDSDIQQKWVRKCRSNKTFNVKNAKICESHFSEDSFARDLKGELLGLPLKRKLLSSAIPTLNLPCDILPSETDNECESALRSVNEKCEQRAIVQKLLESSNASQEQSEPGFKDQESQCSMNQGLFQGWETITYIYIFHCYIF